MNLTKHEQRKSEGVVVIQQRNLKRTSGDSFRLGFMDVIHKADGFMGWHTHGALWKIICNESWASPISTCGIRFREENCGKYKNKNRSFMPSKPTAPLPMRIAVPTCLKTTQHEDCSLQGLAATGFPIISLVLEVSINNWSYITPQFLWSGDRSFLWCELTWKTPGFR